MITVSGPTVRDLMLANEQTREDEEDYVRAKNL